ncbi:CrcB protein [Kroppenstedtia sanguinis]|uniref:Fluoride-specific ion channel FluC n=1 Tax=Kroppenstedtia sanguinis TaxID=1380684 RepID=A0ABW4C725_9BACL
MQILAVGIGGVLGALLRYGLGLALASPEGSFPVGTLTANWIGCLALGWFHSRFSKIFLSPALRGGITTGLIGSFTTFSTFSMETQQLLQSGQIGTACLYLLASLWGGLFLLYIGVRLAKRKGRRAC